MIVGHRGVEGAEGGGCSEERHIGPCSAEFRAPARHQRRRVVKRHGLYGTRHSRHSMLSMAPGYAFVEIAHLYRR